MKETFREYYNRKEKELDEAIKVLNKNGYKVLNEGKITKIIFHGYWTCMLSDTLAFVGIVGIRGDEWQYF